MINKLLALIGCLTLIISIILGIKITSSPSIEGLAHVININPGVGENESHITVTINGTNLTLNLKSKQDCSHYKIGEAFYLSQGKKTNWLIIAFFVSVTISIFIFYKYFKLIFIKSKNNGIIE